MPTVAFSSKCWQNDWFRMIADFKNKADCCMYPFDTTILVINNVEELESVENALQGVADVLVSSESALQGIVSSLNLLEKPNVYALGEMTAVYAAKDYDYLCFVQGDCLTYPPTDWVTPAIRVLETEPSVLLVSPRSEVNTRGEYDSYCSDQAFVARAKDLLRPETYSYRTIDKDYPSYGRLSFEHLVGNYMKATNKRRKILNNAYVIHG